MENTDKKTPNTDIFYTLKYELFYYRNFAGNCGFIHIY